ncbi:ankyrin repeat domain-containing protein [Saccharibacter floricola]|uniref:Ankyrin-like protein n=1 Tax=Saccharibacter floricola DSM 15669 TaxID=1123227 RepID=A0ABQ0NWV2_9PROT|nr:ankyrin repeat domain-containing protein [Saccharibacter floricola]GBQ05348.1 ankyrin-like protein [Saccharibacter floricola DSM 15669]
MTQADAMHFTPEQITALFIDAARSGECSLLKQFLDAGMPINCTDSRGYTPLIVATYNEQIEAARLLLEHGADPNEIDEKGATALSGVAFKGFEDIATLLIDKGAVVDKPNHAGRTPLMFAVMFGRENMARLLLRHGANPELRDAEGMSAREMATHQGLTLFDESTPS